MDRLMTSLRTFLDFGNPLKDTGEVNRIDSRFQALTLKGHPGNATCDLAKAIANGAYSIAHLFHRVVTDHLTLDARLRASTRHEVSVVIMVACVKLKHLSRPKGHVLGRAGDKDTEAGGPRGVTMVSSVARHVVTIVISRGTPRGRGTGRFSSRPPRLHWSLTSPNLLLQQIRMPHGSSTTMNPASMSIKGGANRVLRCSGR
mmetsp:Transcript_101534/g.302919  ORF Transcript_101534/g.302919 Transcript_101534/m.302919 type:complete len:202 (-) Transcript_101534:350-955(-)